MRMVVLVVVVAGCTQIYGLDETEPSSADADGDGIVDGVDNCLTVINPDQDDSDQDSRGDRCDDCPLVANGAGSDFDQDGIGDACDPHPMNPRDCLLLVDTFADPALFAANWTTINNDASMFTITPEPGHVAMRTGTNLDLTILANGTGPQSDVIVRASNVLGDTASIIAVPAYQDKATFYGCSLDPPSAVRAIPNMTGLPGKLIPNQSVTTDIVLRSILEKRAALVAPDLFCRVDYGVSIGTTVALGGTESLMGPAGVMVSGSTSPNPSATVTIDAVSITAVMQSCPPTAYR